MPISEKLKKLKTLKLNKTYTAFYETIIPHYKAHFVKNIHNTIKITSVLQNKKSNTYRSCVGTLVNCRGEPSLDTPLQLVSFVLIRPCSRQVFYFSVGVPPGP